VLALIQHAAESHGIVSEVHKTRIFLCEMRTMLKKHWLLCVYAVLLMTGGCFFVYLCPEHHEAHFLCLLILALCRQHGLKLCDVDCSFLTIR
jgi:hypothetical protein